MSRWTKNPKKPVSPASPRGRCTAMRVTPLTAATGITRCRNTGVLTEDGVCLCNMHLPGYTAPFRGKRKLPPRGPRGSLKTILDLRQFNKYPVRTRVSQDIMMFVPEETSGSELWNKALRCVPEYVKEASVKRDIAQDICCAVLLGDISESDMSAYSNKAANSYFSTPFKYGLVSMDAPVPGQEGITLHDVLSKEDNYAYI